MAHGEISIRPYRARINEALLFGAILFATAWACIAIADRTGGVSPLWLANGYAVALLLMGKPARLRTGAATALLAITAANIVSGTPTPTAFAMAAVNVGEIAGVYLFMRRRGIRPSRPGGLLRFVGLAVAAAGLSAGIASGFLVALADASFSAVAPVWFTADLLGLLITVPPVVGVGRGEFRSMFTKGRAVGAISCLAATLVVSGGVFAQQAYPLLFLVLPVLILATYLLGNPGATLTNAAVAVVAIAATTAGSGPIAGRVQDPHARMMLVQLFLAVNLLVTFLVASVIRQRQHLITELAERERRARRLTEDAPAAIVRVGVDGSIDYANRSFADLVGRDAGALTGTAFSALLSTGAEAKPIDWSHAAGGLTKTLEPALRRSDGAVRHTVLNAAPEYDADGDLIGWIALIVDLSDRHEARIRLEESERSYRLLAEHSHDMIVRLSVDGVRLYVSPACRAVLGYEPEELIGATPVAAIHPEDRARVADVARTLLAGAIDPIASYRQMHRDGHYVWLEAVYRLVRDPASGAPAEFIASVRDISKRHDAELAAGEAAARLHERNRLLVMAEGLAGLGHYRLDLIHDQLFWSAEVYAIHGLAPDTPLSLALGIDAYHPDDRERVRAFVEQAIEHGRGYEFQARILRPDGEMRWVQASGQCETAPNGDIVGLVGVFQDVTARVETERTLIRARQEAEAALAARSIFTSTLSHEIRTPLTGVLAAAELLDQTASPAEQRRYLDTLKTSGKLLSTIIDDVLVFAKLDEGAVEPERVVLELGELVDGVVAAFQASAAAKGLTLHAGGLPEHALVLGDPARIQRVLANLVSNAVKFTATGSVTVTVGPDAELPGHWRFAVADTGEGVPEHQRGRIFEPFVQGDASITRRHGGTGLGLAICRHLVEAMGGGIHAEGNDAGGATFIFTLPLADAGEDVARAADGTMGDDAPASALDLLVAEDNAANRYLVTAILERSGHRVTAVENGVMALDAVRARLDRPFDLVLMDVHMPEMDGVAATREIRMLPEPAAATPICAITAEDSLQRRRWMLDAGMDEVLAKPIGAEALARTLRAFGSGTASAVGETFAGARSSPAGPHVIDPARLRSIEETLGADGCRRMLELLVEDAAERPRMIRRCVESGQPAQVAVEAHGLRGAAAVIGAERLVSALRTLEEAAAKGEIGESLIAAVEDAAAAVLAEGRAELQAAEARGSAVPSNA